MDKKIIIGGTVAAFLMAVGVAGSITAQTAPIAAALSQEQAVAIALAEIPGEVQEVELERENGMSVYEVEILSADGVETEIEIAADTGDILEIEREDEECEKDSDA